MKREGELKAGAMRELRQRCSQFLVLLQATAGAPDRLIAGNGKVTGWEMKHGTPGFVSLGNQELFCMRLNAIGIHTRYVIWQETARGSDPRTLIVHPREVHQRQGWNLKAEASCIGFDHQWLLDQILKAHA